MYDVSACASRLTLETFNALDLFSFFHVLFVQLIESRILFAILRVLGFEILWPWVVVAL